MRFYLCAFSAFLFCSYALLLPVSADEFQELLGALEGMNPRSSLSSLEDFVVKHPQHAQARFQLAKSYSGLRLSAQAEEQFRACMELVPAGSEIHNNCIGALRELSQGAKAQSNSHGPSAAASVLPIVNPQTSSLSQNSVKQYAVLKNDKFHLQANKTKTEPLSNPSSKNLLKPGLKKDASSSRR
ncbi:MAG: hypothetical protein K2X27_21355 [Candidatus Obscuribacterales bacterium]|nr:hypothetical protein [Candidatus Obscuribacterales bacterium]